MVLEALSIRCGSLLGLWYYTVLYLVYSPVKLNSNFYILYFLTFYYFPRSYIGDTQLRRIDHSSYNVLMKILQLFYVYNKFNNECVFFFVTNVAGQEVAFLNTVGKKFGVIHKLCYTVLLHRAIFSLFLL